jgi:hypothetical protein
MIVLMLFLLMSSFAIRINVLTAQEEGLSKYAVVAITLKSGHLSDQRIVIDNDFLSEFVFDEYVVAYFGFFREVLSPKDIVPVQLYYFRGGDPAGFTVIRYSDVSKSTFFTSGGRFMVEGRYATSENEVNISRTLAELNMLSVGSVIEMTNMLINNESNLFTVVGIFEDHKIEVSQELELVSSVPNESGYAHTMAGSEFNINANFILLYGTENTYFSIYERGISGLENEWELFDSGFDAAVYYLRNEIYMGDFMKAVSKTLPEQFVMLDSLDMTIYVSHVLNRTANSFSWLLAIVGTISAIFFTLLFINILKSRIYDIGVLRTRGSKKVKIAFFLTSEIVIVSIISFVIASILYFVLFVPVSNLIYSLQDVLVSNDAAFHSNFTGSIMNAARNHDFIVSVCYLSFVYGFVAVTMLASVTSFVTTIFISRHEPIKTMTKH